MLKGKYIPSVYGERMMNMTEEKMRTASPEAVETPAVRGAPLGAYRPGGVLAAFAAGFLFGGASLAPGGYPLGTALVGALPRYGIPALAGLWIRCLAASAFGGEMLLYAACATVIYLTRILLALWVYGKELLFRAKRVSDTTAVRVLCCTAYVLLFSLYTLLRRGITPFGALSVILTGTAAAAFSFLYIFFLEPVHRGTPAFEAGAAAIAFSVSLAAAPLAVGDFSLGVLVAFGIALYAGHLASPARSASAGLLTGLALGGAYSPVLALSGLSAGAFYEASPFLSGLSAVLVAVCGMLYFEGAEAVMEMLPEVLVSAFTVTLLLRLRILPPLYGKHEETEEELAIRALVMERREGECARRMEEISRAMAALSATLGGFSSRFRRPAPEKLSEKCREIWRSHCKNCDGGCGCRGLAGTESGPLTDKLVSRLMNAGKVDRERLYEMTGLSCPKLDTIAEEISALSAHMLEEAIREDKTQVFAADYEVMAGMFADAAAESDHNLPMDRVSSDKLRRALIRAGVEAENIAVAGDRKKFVILTGRGFADGSLELGTLRETAELVLGMGFSEPVFSLEKGREAVTMESLPLFSVETVYRQLTKKGERVSGDTFSHLQNSDGYYYALLCDGMGSGEDAALTAELCRVFLEKMLLCGNKKGTTLQMLNHFLASRTTESFAALDLLEIDLMEGVAGFLKSGAASSYVIRDRRPYKISSGTFPIGILPEVSAQMTEFELLDGDTILLCSDGVTTDIEEGGEMSSWFGGFLESEWTEDLSRMAEKILAAADHVSSQRDDMTVALVRVRREAR